MRKPSVTTAIACLALFFSLAGTGLAASKYLITSTSQIKPSVLKDLRGSQGPAGPQGLQGTAGTAGPVGAAGAAGAAGTPGAAGSFNAASVTTVVGNDTAMCALGGGDCAVGDSIATCPSGDVVLSGGWLGEDSVPPVEATVAYNEEDGSAAWEVIMANDNSGGVADYAAFAVCAS
jgi:pilus assembly protein FimV